MGDPEARKTELLFAALNARDVDKVRRILIASEELVGAVRAVHADVKWRPLQVAAHIGDLPLVRCLVEGFQALRAENQVVGQGPNPLERGAIQPIVLHCTLLWIMVMC